MKGTVSMKFVVIAAVVLFSASLIGCVQPASLGSLSRAPDARIPKRSPPDVQDCVRVPFPQCSGG
jgi:hypothetical protein